MAILIGTPVKDYSEALTSVTYARNVASIVVPELTKIAQTPGWTRTSTGEFTQYTAAQKHAQYLCLAAYRTLFQGEAYAGYQDRTSNCGHADVSLEVNPFAAEIHDEYRCIWTCDECYDDLAGDI